MTSPEAYITQMYVGYFNRAPDPEGLGYWMGQYKSGMAMETIADVFAQHTEAFASRSYSANTAAAFVIAVYDNLFDRAPDAASLASLAGQMANGKSAGRTIIDIISNARGNDKAVIDYKTAIAQSYVAQFGTATGETFRMADAKRVMADIENSLTFAAPTEQLQAGLIIGNGLTITLLDASGTLAPYEAGIRQSLIAAWDMWADHFTRTAPIEIEVTFKRGAQGVIASAGSSVEVYTSETYKGLRLTQSGVGYELQTGRDPNGAAPDGRITIATDLSRLVFRDAPDDAMPRDKLDALSVFSHELGHILGFRSALDAAGKPLKTSFMTNYDKYVQGLTADSLTFQGLNAMAVKGGAIALASSGPAHLGGGGDLMATSLGMGQTKLVGVLDVAVLKDLGLPVSLAGFDGFA